MTHRWWPGRSSLIGVDLSGHALTALQLDGSGCAPRILATASVRRQGDAIDAADVARLAECLDRQGFRGRSIALAVPDEHLILEPIELPPRDSGAPIEQLARLELAGAHRMPPDAFEFGSWDLSGLGQRSSGTRLLTVGCRHENSERLLLLFDEAGLEVEHLTAAPVALARAAAPALSLHEGPTVLLNLAWDAVDLVIAVGDAVVCARALTELGLSTVSRDAARDQGLDGETVDLLLRTGGTRGEIEREGAAGRAARAVGERLVTHLERIEKEVVLSMGYVAQEHDTDEAMRLLLAGAGATLPGTAELLGALTGAETRVIDPVMLGASVPASIDAGSDFTMAYGLAIDDGRGD